VDFIEKVVRGQVTALDSYSSRSDGSPAAVDCAPQYFSEQGVKQNQGSELEPAATSIFERTAISSMQSPP